MVLQEASTRERSPTTPNKGSHSGSLSSLLNTQEESLPTPTTPSSAQSSQSSFGSFALARTKKLSPTPGKPYVCEQCNATFTRPHNLKSHLATHSSVRPYKCEQCNRFFRRQHDLKRHWLLHTGTRPHICKMCSRKFARLDALHRHQRTESGTGSCTVMQSKCATPRRPPIPHLNIPHIGTHVHPKPITPATPSPSSKPSHASAIAAITALTPATPSPTPISSSTMVSSAGLSPSRSGEALVTTTSPVHVAKPWSHSTSQGLPTTPAATATPEGSLPWELRSDQPPLPSLTSILPITGDERSQLTGRTSPPASRYPILSSPTSGQTWPSNRAFQLELHQLREEITRLKDDSALIRLERRVRDLEVQNNLLLSLVKNQGKAIQFPDTPAADILKQHP